MLAFGRGTSGSIPNEDLGELLWEKWLRTLLLGKFLRFFPHYSSFRHYSILSYTADGGTRQPRPFSILSYLGLWTGGGLFLTFHVKSHRKEKSCLHRNSKHYTNNKLCCRVWLLLKPRHCTPPSLFLKLVSLLASPLTAWHQTVWYYGALRTCIIQRHPSYA